MDGEPTLLQRLEQWFELTLLWQILDPYLKIERLLAWFLDVATPELCVVLDLKSVAMSWRFKTLDKFSKWAVSWHKSTPWLIATAFLVDDLLERRLARMRLDHWESRFNRRDDDARYFNQQWAACLAKKQ